jgi:hypothetical protein
MSKRLQVLLDEPEWREIQRAARAERTTVAEWVRQALRAARRAASVRPPEAKVSAIRTAARHAFPTADISQMNAETARGYLGGRADDSR